MNTEPASGSKKRPRNEKLSEASSEDSVPARDGENPNILGGKLNPPTAAATQPKDVQLAIRNLMDESSREDMEATECPIICSDWREHVDLILVTQSNNMLKELIERKVPPMLAKVNTIIQREATQAIRDTNS